MGERNNGWIDRKIRLPTMADGDTIGRIFAWHAYQGAILVRWDEFSRISFNMYWMRTEDAETHAWIEAGEKVPTKLDADEHNCILALNKEGELCITGYHQFTWNSDLVKWKPLPLPPSDYKELRKMQ